MEVFVAGATGVLGRRLVDMLTGAGHDVVGLHREGSADVIEAAGGTPHQGNVLNPDSFTDGVAGCDVLVNVATSIPTSTKPTTEEWQRNDRVRREGSRNLFKAAKSANVDHFLQESVVWVARQPDGSEFDEDAPRNPDRTTQSVADTERFLLDAESDANPDVSVLRAGWLYGPDSAQLRSIAEGLLDGKMPVVVGGLLGRKDSTLSVVHADDAARAYVRAVENSTTGLWHVVDDRPVTFAEFMHTFADVLDAKDPRHVPGWLAKFFVGSDTVQFFTNSMPTANDGFREAAGWEPIYPDCEAGLEAVVETWQREGYPFDVN